MIDMGKAFGCGKFRTYIFKLRYAAVFLIIAAGVMLFAGGYEIIQTSGTAAEGIRLPILMYHSLLKDTARSGDYVITPSQLEEDLIFLNASGYSSVVMSDLINYVYKGTPLPDKPVLLTFDDGYYNNLTYAVPLLEKYGFKAVISIVGEYTDKFSEEPDENPSYAYMSWKNVREAMDSGVIEIQNHTYNMHSAEQGGRMGAAREKYEADEEYELALERDLIGMQKRCLAELGYLPTVLTYPFGSYGRDTERLVRKFGFLASLSCNEGVNILTGDREELYLMKRYNRTCKRSAERLLRKIYEE